MGAQNDAPAACGGEQAARLRAGEASHVYGAAAGVCRRDGITAEPPTRVQSTADAEYVLTQFIHRESTQGANNQAPCICKYPVQYSNSADFERSQQVFGDAFRSTKFINYISQRSIKFIRVNIHRAFDAMDSFAYHRAGGDRQRGGRGGEATYISSHLVILAAGLGRLRELRGYCSSKV